MNKYTEIRNDVEQVLKGYGSDAEERQVPGSKAAAQANRIVEFIRQWDVATDLLAEHALDLITITRR